MRAQFFDLSRRENERASGQQVYVQVKDGLPAVTVGVDDHAIAVVGESLFTGDIGGGQEQVAELTLIAVFRLVERIDMISRDYQNMRWSLRR